MIATPPPFIIDTNVLVAAMGNYYRDKDTIKSNARWVIAGIQGIIQYYYFPSLLGEYFKLLRDANIKGMPYLKGKPRPPEWFDAFLENGTFLENDPPYIRQVGTLWAADEIDQRILQCGFDMNAVIVTNDDDDFPEGSRSGVEVLKPAQAIKQFAPALFKITQWP